MQNYLILQYLWNIALQIPSVVSTQMHNVIKACNLSKLRKKLSADSESWPTDLNRFSFIVLAIPR